MGQKNPSKKREKLLQPAFMAIWVILLDYLPVDVQNIIMIWENGMHSSGKKCFIIFPRRKKCWSLSKKYQRKRYIEEINYS